MMGLGVGWGVGLASREIPATWDVGLGQGEKLRDKLFCFCLFWY